MTDFAQDNPNTGNNKGEALKQKLTEASERIKQVVSEDDQRGFSAIVDGIKGLGEKIDREVLNADGDESKLANLVNFLGEQLEAAGKKLQDVGSDKNDAVTGDTATVADTSGKTSGKASDESIIDAQIVDETPDR